MKSSSGFVQGPRCVRLTLAAAMLGVLLLTGGCGGTTKVETRTTTVGQELQDLENARNKGLVTEAEYSKKREEIMKRK
jgi:hypothetical protein